MTKEEEAIFDKARWARASFYAATRAILDMEAKGYLGSTNAIKLIRKEMERQRSEVDAADALLNKMVSDFLTSKSETNDVPPV